MSESSPAPQTGSPPAKRRNPVELILVRGFIVVMLVLVAIEGNSWWQHKQALAALSAKMKAVDEVEGSLPVTMADVKSVLGSKQFRTEELDYWTNHAGANRVDIYSWFTISPVNKREIYVYYWKKTKKEGDQEGAEDTNPEVLAVQADNKPPEEPPKVADDQPAASPAESGAPAMMPPGMMAPGTMPPGAGPGGPRGGGPGGRPGGRPPASDADAEKANTEKSDADKPPETKSGDDKPKDAEAEKNEQ